MMTPVTFWKLVNKPFSVAYVISLLDMAEIPRFLVRFIILFQQRQVPKIWKCCNQSVCAQFNLKFKSSSIIGYHLIHMESVHLSVHQTRPDSDGVSSSIGPLDMAWFTWNQFIHWLDCIFSICPSDTTWFTWKQFLCWLDLEISLRFLHRSIGHDLTPEISIWLR